MMIIHSMIQECQRYTVS